MPSAIHVPSVPDPLTRLPFSRPDLGLLDAVGQCGDLVEAARRTGLRAAAARRRLDRLDQATGLRLTLSNARTVRLSPDGARVLVAGRRFFRQVDQAVQTEIYGRGTEALNAPRILDIATAEPLMEDLVEDAADTLGVLLSVSHDTPAQVLRQFAGYRVDAAHTWGVNTLSHAVDRAVRTYDVLDDPLWVTLPLGHPLAGRDAVSLADLREENWVSEAGPQAEVLVSRVYQSAGLTSPARIQVTGASVARGMLRRGDAIGLGSPACPAVFAPSLVRRSLVERPRRAAGLLVDPTVVPGSLAQQLAALLTARCLSRFSEHHGDLLRDPWWADWLRGQRAELERRTDAAARSLRTPPALPDKSAEVDVEDLRLLQAVADHGSINRAAAVLSISQSALTRRIHRLELRIGARLLLRSSRGTDLTAPTRQFLARLADFGAELHAVVGLTGAGGTLPTAEADGPRRRAQPAPRGGAPRPVRTAERSAARPAVAGRS
ncbi:LysR family transcriptional regulator [Streptomyces sp. NBC_01754]|uniref:LysR family transcriptional regulator n=1 Tax=Streptomyces sp. NBC_01754 TaxID=2975930 RepID=UPI002DDC464A|nr:LysR family transcriptional regulator [Streptomyces sp. NBC_01754]WSC91421.1 LysR family transcriptional regulator [Streptomyces sp. NBC_01754]